MPKRPFPSAPPAICWGTLITLRAAAADTGNAFTDG